MKVNRAYKYELDPNRGQLILLAKHAGTARFAYNWGLARKKEVVERLRETGIKEKVPTAIDLDREINVLKRTDFLWMYEGKALQKPGYRVQELLERQKVLPPNGVCP